MNHGVLGHDELGWWARFNDFDRWVRSGLGSLIIADREGFRLAARLDDDPFSDPLYGAKGFHGGPPFVLEPTGCVKVDLEFENREPAGIPTERPEINTQLLRSEPTDTDPLSLHSWACGEGRWLRPGRYRVTSTGEFHENFEREIEVFAGATTEVLAFVELVHSEHRAKWGVTRR